MSKTANGAGLTIFSGRFGSGKTEAAINYACAIAQGTGLTGRSGPAQSRPSRNGRDGLDVVLVDLDIVTPYFRSREMAETMRPRRVEVIAPSIIGQHLDTPALTPQILGAIQQVNRPTVLDVGGDRQGARVLGSFSAAVQERGYIMHFVVNPYRPFTSTAHQVASSIGEIATSARLEVTSLVSNPNLMGETTAEHIGRGHGLVEGFAEELGLPIAFVCVERRWMSQIGLDRFAQPILPLERFFVQPWE